MTPEEQRVKSILVLKQIDRLPFATWRIGKRKQTLYMTIHYNGPAVSSFGNVAGELDQIRSDARWHMRPDALGATNGGDGIQYHGGTLSDGSNWQFRPFDDMLWHCANYAGNTLSLSWHLPLGGNQRPTQAQISGLNQAIDAFRLAYNINAVNVKGHLQWSQTLCPGNVYPVIVAYRQQAIYGKPIVWYKTLYNANCREAPDVHSPIALDGHAVYPAGTVFAVDQIKENGVPYNNNPTYVHRADGIGFFHISVVTPVFDGSNVRFLVNT